MAYKRSARALAYGVALTTCGIVGTLAWAEALWGVLTGAVLISFWLACLSWLNAARLPYRSVDSETRTKIDDADQKAVLQRLLLDAAPTPLLAIEQTTAQALNRAARAVFATNNRILPPPSELFDPAATHLRYEGRNWRIDRVEAAGAGAGVTVAALIDFENEERAAEARSSAELIEILGHEMLNGLAPIVSLAESAQTAIITPPVDLALLNSMLGPIARRAEGLRRFAQDYRALAKLPAPTIRYVALKQFAGDIARAFDGIWPEISLELSMPDELTWPMDPDQINQAVWALLQNAAEAATITKAPHVALMMTQIESRLAISVADNGLGIPLEQTAVIFRPFHTTKQEGSGIGLTLARQIVVAHGGDLDLVSANPTMFRLLLPK